MYNFPRLINATLAVVPAVDGRPVDVFGHLSGNLRKKFGEIRF